MNPYQRLHAGPAVAGTHVTDSVTEVSQRIQINTSCCTQDRRSRALERYK